MIQLKSIFNKSKKDVAVRINRRLKKEANKLDIDVKETVAKKLLETYRYNLEMSYGPRSLLGDEYPYEHTNTLYDSVSVDITDKEVKIVLIDDYYENGKSVEEVDKYLTEGTDGGGNYVFKDEYGLSKLAYNYPTPKHLYKEHTREQMKGYMENLKHNIKNKRRWR